MCVGRGGGEGWVNIRMCVLGGGRRGIGEYTYVCVRGVDEHTCVEGYTWGVYLWEGRRGR